MRGRAYLALEAVEGGIAVGLVGGGRILAGRDGLIQAIADAVGEAKPAGILVSGVAERFSESRSLSTVASVLAYAWGVKAVSLRRPLPAGASEARIRAALARGRWPLAPAYSGKPNITVPKVEKAAKKAASKRTR